MSSVQTLHDFTLNLLSNPAALQAFGSDPQQALAAAGLGDVSAADVHEVIPLVLDYVPVDNLNGLGGVPQFGDLTERADVPQEGLQGAIAQLHALTAGLGLPAAPELPGAELPGLPSVPAGVPSVPAGIPSVPAGVPGVPAVPGTPDLGLHAPALPQLPGEADVTNAAAGVTALAHNPTGAFGYAGDLAHGIDSNPVGQANFTVNNAAGQVNNSLDNAVGQAQHVGGELAGAAQGAGLPVPGELPNPIGDLGGHAPSAGDVTGALGGVGGHIGDLTGGLQNASDLDVKHLGGDLAGNAGANVGTQIANAAHNGVDAAHNAVGVAHNGAGDVTGAIGNGAGVSDVHDVVSHVGNCNDLGHNAIGNVHTGDIGSGNDLHISF
ncbi:IniB N-terminal domain-containing protein [Amycolatopsis sp. NPDC059021]|uniref:IniB N-terminal domain-containing protein n=1 Tax=Amycolatopsis sp. NPDC059021 TaxID=3346704 RepID=UPI003671E6FE